jgi:two-component system response regulator NreC
LGYVLMSKIRLLIVDDHTLFRESLRSHLNTIENFEVIGEANDGIAAVETVGQLNPDIVLMDYAMPDLNGLGATIQIKKKYPSVKILILTMYETGPHIQQILAAGASGYITKKAPTQELVSAIRSIYNGDAFLCPSAAKRLLEDYLPKVKKQDAEEIGLTMRETELLALIAEGKTNKEISKLLNISINTVKVHRLNLMKKLDIHDSTQIVRYAIRKSLILP